LQKFADFDSFWVYVYAVYNLSQERETIREDGKNEMLKMSRELGGK